MKSFTRFASAVAILSLIVNCGGGGREVIEFTQRPKTMDGIVIRVATGSSFEFVRTNGSEPAIESGDIETGTFFYSFNGINIMKAGLDNLIGSKSNIIFPDSISAASYTYRAINANQGILTLTGNGVLTDLVGAKYPVSNGSHMHLFVHDSNYFDSNQVEFDISFGANGGNADPGLATMSMVGSFSGFDKVRAPLTMTLKTGGKVPLNYNPVIDPNRPSKVVPLTLDDKLISFTNTGIPDVNYDFSIQFVTDASPTGTPVPGTEIGTGLMRINDVPVPDAVDYTWRPIQGTDTAELVITGSDSTFDGSFILNFVGTDNGTYEGEDDGDTANVDEVIGSFLVD